MILVDIFLYKIIKNQQVKFKFRYQFLRGFSIMLTIDTEF